MKSLHPEAPILSGVAIAMLVISSVAQGDLTISPFVMSGLMARYHVPENLGVFALSAQLGAVAIAALASSAILGRLRIDILGRLAIGMVFFGQLISVVAPTFMVMAATRILIGVGEGLGIAITYAYLSQPANSARLLSLQGMLTVVAGVALTLIVPWTIGRFGQTGVFILSTASAALMLPCAFALPSSHMISAPIAGGAKPAVGATALSVLLAVTFALMISAGANLLWLLSAQLGLTVGLTVPQISILNSAGASVGFLTAFLAYHTSRRFRELWPMLLLCLLMAVTGWFWVETKSKWIFALCNLGNNIGYSWGAVLIRITCADSDHSGRSTAAVGGADTAGWVVGPLVAGVVATIWPGNAGVGGVAVMMFVIAGAAVWWRRAIGVGASGVGAAYDSESAVAQIEPYRPV